MKKVFLILFALFTLLNAPAQRHYYVGIPFHKCYLKDSTRFVIDCLPWNPNGRLDQAYMPYYLEPLKQFMAMHPGYKCNFLLYSHEENEEKNLAFTTYQAKRLAEYFTNVDTLFGQKYLNEIIPHSGPNPLFKDIQPDSSQRLPRWEANVALKSSVIIEVIRKKPIDAMAMVTAYYAQPCEGEDFDVAPSFPGGINGLYEYLDKRMDYSVVGGFVDVIGVVLVEFTIEADGSVTSPEIKMELFSALDEQALRIVSEMPRWNPAFKDGHPVRCRYRIPMRYSM
ncbi:MAG: energy transducer TonB [Bacteroidales bacterium]|nr:energy transducer TonB [Bacteroidales bacterium]